MASSKHQNRNLHVAIYWCGAELGQISKPIHRCSTISAGRSLGSEIRSEVWPRWDSLDLITRTKGGLILNPALPWFGVFSDGTNTHLLEPGKTSKRTFEITPHTTASLRMGDLSVAIRVAPPPRITKKSQSQLPGYSRSVLGFIADKKFEWISLGVASVAAAIISLSAYTTLKTRPTDHYSSIQELPGEKLLPFISQRYLAEAPYVMQEKLDRFDFIHSVWDYYGNFVQVVAFGSKPQKTSDLFSSTTETYISSKEERKKQIEQAEARQQSKINSGGSILTMPLVHLETLDGQTQRTLDKIHIVSETAKELAEKRNKIAESYEQDIGYKYEPPTNAGNKSFSAISAGFLGLEDDEKSQYTQAKSLATKASILQIDLFGKDRLMFGAIQCCTPPAGAPLVMDELTWLNPVDIPHDGFHLAALKASVWGAPVKNTPQLREPKSGHIERQLVEKTIASGRYQLRLCYELALRRNQLTFGSMEWSWQVDTRGQPNHVQLLKSNIKDDELVRCVRDKIASWKFPKAKGGSVEIRYPFEFLKDKG